MSRRFAAFALLGLLVACDSEIDDKTAATVKEAPAAAPAKAPADPAPAPAKAPSAVPEGAWTLAADSSIEWIGAKVTKDHPGGFKALSGHASVADGALKSATVVIDLASLYSDHPKLEKHLKSDDFFDIAQFPTSTFEITGVGEGQGGQSTVTGTLDLHGVKKEISFPATVAVDGAKASVTAEFTLNRGDFGMTYPGKADDLIRDEVLVKGTLAFGG